MLAEDGTWAGALDKRPADHTRLFVPSCEATTCLTEVPPLPAA